MVVAQSPLNRDGNSTSRSTAAPPPTAAALGSGGANVSADALSSGGGLAGNATSGGPKTMSFALEIGLSVRVYEHMRLILRDKQ